MEDFASLIEKEVPRLRRYAHALVRDPTAADDLVQDCLERAWRKSHLWIRRHNLGGWLITIMHNLHANQVRKYHSSPRILAMEDVSAPASPPGQAEALNLGVLRDALASLSPEHQQVLLLVGMEQLRYEEVARMLGIPIGTVMSRLFRARERLRILLSESTGPTLRRVK